MTDPLDKKPAPKVTPSRIALWVLVAGVAVYLIVVGVIGVIHNG